jgi:hypothetical protein
VNSKGQNVIIIVQRANLEFLLGAVPRAILCLPTTADLQALQLQDGRRGAEMVPPAWEQAARLLMQPSAVP